MGGPLRPEVLSADDYSQRAYIELLRGDNHAALGDSARARADYEISRSILERARPRHSEDELLYASLGIAYAGLGERPAAMGSLARAIALALPKKNSNATLALDFAAEAYARLGETKTAIDLVARALSRTGRLTPQYLRLEPRWDPLRREPRFQALVTGRGTG